MFILKLKHQFSAAHKLTNAYSKECNDFLHGHNWKVKVEIKASHLIDGMIIDFKKIKSVINKLDHKNLMTDVPEIDFEPTAENLSKYLYEKIYEVLKKKYELDSTNKNSSVIKLAITIWETDGASIKYYE